MMEHATQYPEEYSKVASVQKKVRHPWVHHHLCLHTNVANCFGSHRLTFHARSWDYPRSPAACYDIGALPGHHACIRAHPQVDEVKGIMTENIEKVLARGEKLELLTDKTENLMNEVRQGAPLGPAAGK